ncbi:unnamed protein product, partial [marine sediment metagenome]
MHYECTALTAELRARLPRGDNKFRIAGYDSIANSAGGQDPAAAG